MQAAKNDQHKRLKPIQRYFPILQKKGNVNLIVLIKTIELFMHTVLRKTKLPLHRIIISSRGYIMWCMLFCGTEWNQHGIFREILKRGTVYKTRFNTMFNYYRKRS